MAEEKTYKEVGKDPTYGNSVISGAAPPEKSGAPKVKDYKALNLKKYSLGKIEGNLQSLQDMQGQNPLDTEGYDAYKSYAMRDPSQQANSAWGGMMLDKQGQEEIAQRDLAASQGAGALATGRSNLAQRGGLSGAAAERMGSAGMRDQMMQNQAVTRQGAVDRSNINIQDETNRMGAMEKVPGMAIANRASHQTDTAQQALTRQNDTANQMNASQFDATLAGQENDRANTWNMDKYGIENQEYGAGEIADAMKQAKDK